MLKLQRQHALTAIVVTLSEAASLSGYEAGLQSDSQSSIPGLVPWPWAGYLTILGLNYLICIMGIIIVSTLLGNSED